MEDLDATLGSLAHSLRAHALRRGTMGVRRIERATRPEPGVPGRSSAPERPSVPEPRAAPEPRSPEPVPDSPPLTPVHERAAAARTLDDLRQAVAECRACPLCESRTQTVFADGTGSSGVMFVGEAPGFHEDRQGVPFIGPAGQLLTDIIEKGMGLKREEVTICNVLKCRPPENRDPSADEKALCTAWLDRQIELVDPRVIIPLGRHAAGHLLSSDASMARLRGRVHDRASRKVVATYHPAFLLRSPGMKRECWKDIQLAMEVLGLPRPGPR